MKIEIYGTEDCQNCSTAKSLSIKAKLDVKMLKLEKDYVLPDLFKKIGKRVFEFPQIFVDSKYIGNLKNYQDFLKENIKEEEVNLDDLSI